MHALISVIFKSYRAPDGVSHAYGVLNDAFVVTRAATRHDEFFGLGEKTRSFNRAGKNYMLWNTDILTPPLYPEHQRLPKTHPARDPTSTAFDPYYMSIPFFYHMPVTDPARQMAGFFVDNGYKAYFEFSHAEYYRYQFCGGQYTEYVFAGSSMRELLAGYTWITGRMSAPPLWALGYHQCRWHRYTQKTFLQLAATLRRKKIPCDTLWLDIDHMDGYRVFTWNRDIFPNVKAMLKQLARAGFRVITIIDPGVKHERGYRVFDEAVRRNLLCKTESGRLYIGEVWPGRTAFPNFAKPETRRWWGRLNAGHVRHGLAGIWNDMNEPATGKINALDMWFDHDGRVYPHERFHNQYGLLMAMATADGLRKARPNLRPFVLSRAGSAGIQRYAANWLGDNFSRWDHLAMSIPMATGLGVSGQPFVGADVGGFCDPAQPELLVRWMQYAALTPFFRNHNGNPQDQYPWSFGPETERRCRAAIEFRYRLLPYIYTAFMQASETGAPIQRPLLYDFQQDPVAVGIEDQYLFGDALLVAPVCKPGRVRRRVYLPAGGTWINWHTGKPYAGGRWIVADAPPDYIPVFVRGGAVVPMLPRAPQSTRGLRPDRLELHVFVPKDAATHTSALYEDDGETLAYQTGRYVQTTFTLERAGADIRMQTGVTGKSFSGFTRTQYTLIVHGPPVREICLNGERVRLRNNRVSCPV